MQFFRKFAVTVVALAGTAPHAFALEEYHTTPGSRAMAMAGAFSAYAADSSSIWYNPAGLGFQSSGSSDFTIEYGDTLIAREELKDNGDGTVDIYDTSKELKYIGFSTHGVGIAYFRPYEFSSYSYSPDTDETARVVTTYQELKFGFGFKLSDSLALGTTLDMISREGELTDSDCSGFSCADDEDLSSISLGLTLGALFKTRLIEETMTDLHLSAVYRSGALGDSSSDYAINEFEDLPTRPTTKSLGAALRGPLTFIDAGEWAFFATLTAQHDINEYEKVILLGTNESLETEFTKTAFGLELQAVTPTNMSLFFRAGVSDTDSDGDKVNLSPAFPEFRPYTEGIKSTTFGVGIVFGDNNQFVLDYGVEKRKILASDFTDVDDEEETLSSLSFSMLL